MADSGTRVSDQSWVEVDFNPDPGFELVFDGMKGHEELGRPFLYEVDLSSGTQRVDVSALIGATATVWMAQSDEDQEDRFLNGIVTRAIAAGMSGGTYRYQVQIRPWIWLLTRHLDCRIFQKKSAFAIITQVFRDAKLTDFRDNRHANAGDIELEYCVQYRETSYDFVTRLMEQFGLYYFFEHERGKHTLVIADDPGSHIALANAIPFAPDQTEFRTVSDHIWEWAADLALVSGKVTFQDYNFTTPSADLTARSVKSTRTPADFEVYDYPGLYGTTSDGQRLADVRMQAIDLNRAIYRGISNSRHLRSGGKFSLSRHKDEKANREYLITRSDLTIDIAEGASTVDGETLDTYRVAIQAIPGDVPFRLDQVTPRPSITGPQTARVVGHDGDEVMTDEYGRVKVKFFWDRATTEDSERTCWIRVAHSWAGASWGSIFIPRVGQEVVVEFLEGSPDRPLITGVVYNASTQVPYRLPDNQTVSAIRTNSSPGGNGFNELKFEDKAGEEKVFFHAQKDFEKKVLNNETISVHKSSTTTIETGDRSLTVSQGNQTVTVSVGNHTLDVTAGSSTTTAGQSITLRDGASSLKIDNSGVTINGPKISLN
jgi:type VI secretion system secreted protein VgrG